MMSWFFIPLLQRLACGESGSSKLVIAPSWKITHSLICGILGLFLIVLATTNPSLALVFSIPLVPVIMHLHPACSAISFFLQFLILTLLSPPFLLVWYALFHFSIAEAVSFSATCFHYWDLYGALLLPIVCIFYWSLNIGAQLLIVMES